MKVLICGSRDYTNHLAIKRRVDELPDDTIVIEGGASGADSWARYAAIERGLHVAQVKPLYTTHGRAAPLLRNQAMLRLEPDLVIAFSSSNSSLTSGTSHVTLAAKREGIPIEIHFANGVTQSWSPDGPVHA